MDHRLRARGERLCERRSHLLRFGFLLFVVAVSMLLMRAAAAGGRCEEMLPEPCLNPQRGEPGTLVEVTRATFRVVWNEPRGDALGFRYQPDQDRTLLVAVEDGSMQEGLTFRVPDVPPGSYEVVIYDVGSYWWDRFSVTRSGFDGRPYLVLGLGLIVLAGSLRILELGDNLKMTLEADDVEISDSS